LTMYRLEWLIGESIPKMMETLLCEAIFNPIKRWKMEQTTTQTIQCSVDKNAMIQSSVNFMEMEAMTCYV